MNFTKGEILDRKLRLIAFAVVCLALWSRVMRLRWADAKSERGGDQPEPLFKISREW